MTDLALNGYQQAPGLGPGELVGARYRLKRVAGSGGMATVWLAYDERLQRPVALKVISPDLAANPAAVARFAREARTHARIQHPNLVEVYDYSITAVQPYLVMEYINGSTLSERLDLRGFTAGEARTLAVELLSALACIHDHGVLHRDIKSANVLLDSAGRAHLTDLGLARLEDSGPPPRATTKIFGTLRFLAPELLEGAPPSRQSDLYALGVLLRSAVADAEAHSELSRVIDWLTAHDPRERPADARAALVVLQAETEAEAHGQPQPESPRKPQSHISRLPQSEASFRRPGSRAASANGTPGPAAQRVSGYPPDGPRAAGSHRHGPRAGGRVRNRAIAATAVTFALAGTAFTLASTGGAHGAAAGGRHAAHRPAAVSTPPPASTPAPGSSTAHAKAKPTLNQQLQQLATGVKAASVQ